MTRVAVGEGNLSAGRFKAATAEPDARARSRALDALFADWADHDAPGASAFALTLEDETLRRACMLRVMQVWGARDAAAALDWAEGAGFETAYEREIMMSMACTTVARGDPLTAVELALVHGLDGFVNGVMEALVAQWAETDLMAASAWVAAREPGERRDALVESVALVVFEVDPVQAARLIFDQLPVGEGRDRALGILFSRLAGQDTRSVREWAESLPEGRSRDRTLEQIERVRGGRGMKPET